MAETHHATGLVIDGRGLLIRGPSGAGKSLLALALLDRAAMLGTPAGLVADDRVGLAPDGGMLIMTCPPSLAGKIELRGRGILEVPYLAQARLHLVIDLVPDFVRMPEAADFSIDLLDVTLVRAPVPRAGVVDLLHQVMLVEAALAQTADDT